MKWEGGNKSKDGDQNITANASFYQNLFSSPVVTVLWLGPGCLGSGLFFLLLDHRCDHVNTFRWVGNEQMRDVSLGA